MRRMGPPRKPFRFVSLLPYLGLISLLLWLWSMVPKGPFSPEPGTIESATPVVVVDAGHGGHDNGAMRGGLVEKALTLDTALRLERLLKQRGFTVVMTRRDDRFIELYERSQVANQYARALFVSVHFNDNATESGEGVETFFASEKIASGSSRKVEPPPADKGAAFAQAVQQSLVSRLGALDRGTKERSFAVVRHTRCPAVLVEGGFMNNPAELRLLKEPAYRERLAGAIAEGVTAYHRQRVVEAAKGTVAKSK